MRTFIAFWPAFTQQMTGLAVVSLHSDARHRSNQAAIKLLELLCVCRRLHRRIHVLPPTLVRDQQRCSGVPLTRRLVALAATVIEAVLIDFVGRRMLFLGGIVATWMMLMIVGGLGLIPDKSYSLNQLVVRPPPPLVLARPEASSCSLR